MQKLISKDGTLIAYERQGNGPTLILVDGALEHGIPDHLADLAELLAPHFTVVRYDRRGRGGSGDTLPYAVEREVEDITALIREAGAPAYLYGHSSGASLALEVAIQLEGQIRKLALYEAPYNSDPETRQAWKRYLQDLKQSLDDGRGGDAVALFMRFVGTPDEQIAGMRLAPFWAGLESIAPTLVYDHAEIIGEDLSVPVQKAARVTIPALIMNGSASYPFMEVTAQALTRAMPHAQHRILAGQTHNVAAEVLAPALIEFFEKEQAR
jgi:pimeloyl-ACP methyl ester carboxylesterase